MGHAVDDTAGSSTVAVASRRRGSHARRRRFLRDGQQHVVVELRRTPVVNVADTVERGFPKPGSRFGIEGVDRRSTAAREQPSPPLLSILEAQARPLSAYAHVGEAGRRERSAELVRRIERLRLQFDRDSELASQVGIPLVPGIVGAGPSC